MTGPSPDNSDRKPLEQFARDIDLPAKKASLFPRLAALPH
jgi:hypothetical protein